MKGRHQIGRQFLILLVLTGMAMALVAQTASPSPSPGASPVPGTSPSPSPTAEAFPVKPYTDEEFPAWMLTARRFEVIAVGAFPFAFMNANWWFDIGRYTGKYIQGDSDASSYVPWPLSPASKPANTKAENAGVLLGSIGLSLIIALIDLILGFGESPESSP